MHNTVLSVLQKLDSKLAGNAGGKKRQGNIERNDMLRKWLGLSEEPHMPDACGLFTLN